MLVSDVIDRVFGEWFYPSGVNRPAFDILSTGIDNDDLTIMTEGRQESIPRDTVVEIDSELILVKDRSGAQLTVAERGYLDTVAASHSSGAKVLVDPKYPRKIILNALASVIGLLYPWGLYARATTTLVVDTSIDQALPADAVRVLRVRNVDLDHRKLMRGRDYLELDEYAPMKVRIRGGAGSGANLIIVYAKDFTRPAAEADNLTTAGVPETLQPYLPMAVAGYLLQGQELPRVQVEEIRRMLASQGIQVGAALNIGQALLQQFRQTYVAAERARLMEKDPVQFEIVRDR